MTRGRLDKRSAEAEDRAALSREHTVSPLGNRFTALRQFELWACNADDGDDCASDAGFSLVYTSPADAFPGDPPRPVAPHMLLRSFDIPDTQATHLRLVVKTNQCTGGPAFQGDQDATRPTTPTATRTSL